MGFKVGGRLWLVVVIIAGIVLAGFYGMQPVRAAPIIVGSSILAPANGTGDSLNLTFLAQQWVGFYGNLTMTIVMNGSASNYSLLNSTVKNGTVYVTNAGENPNFATGIVANVTDPNTDSNFSLTGEYTMANMGFSNATAFTDCGVSNVWYLNTTDNIPVAILKDQSTAPKYYMCSRVIPQSSATDVLHTDYQYAIIAPKTSTYGNSGYDLYYDGGVT
jgi:hypothetical protein